MRHCVSNRRQLRYAQQLVPKKKENIKTPHECFLCVRNPPVKRNAFPCHYVIMWFPTFKEIAYHAGVSTPASLLSPLETRSPNGSQHYDDVIMTTITSQITSLTIVYSTVYSGTDDRKHQSSASLAFVRGIHRGPVNSPHKGPVMRKMFTFDDVIMGTAGGPSGIYDLKYCFGTYEQVESLPWSSTRSNVDNQPHYEHLVH